MLMLNSPHGRTNLRMVLGKEVYPHLPVVEKAHARQGDVERELGKREEDTPAIA